MSAFILSFQFAHPRASHVLPGQTSNVCCCETLFFILGFECLCYLLFELWLFRVEHSVVGCCFGSSKSRSLSDVYMVSEFGWRMTATIY